MTGLRKLSPVLLVAFGLELAFALASLGHRLAGPGEPAHREVDRWSMASTGIWALFAVMAGIGLFDLAGRLAGRAAIGVRVAGIAIVAAFCFGTLMTGLFVLDLIPHDEWVWNVDQYVYWSVATAAAVGLLVASRARPVALVAFGVCMLVQPPPILGDAMFGNLGLGYRGTMVLYIALGIARTVGLLVLAIGVSDGIAPPRYDLAVKGFDRAAGALWLRVVAAAIGMVFGLIAAAAVAQGSAALLKLTMIAALVVNLASFTVFGLGALDVARSALDGISRYAAAIAGAASLWCAGVMLSQLPHFYQILYRRDELGSSGQERLAALSVAMPLVGTLSCGVFAGVMAAFARARGDLALAGRASSAGTSYVLLMLASVGIQTFLLEEARSSSALIGMVLVAAGCGLVAQMILSRVCRAASFSLDAAPGLPTAVAKISDPT